MPETKHSTRDQHSYRFILRVLNGIVPINEIDPSILSDTFREIARLEEIEKPIRDTWGNWDWQYADAQRNGTLYQPTLDKKISKLQKQLKKQLPYPRWPNGKKFAVCLTHDVDFVSQIALSRKAAWQALNGMRRAKITPLKKSTNVVRLLGQFMLQPLLRRGKNDPLWKFEQWLELENSYGFHSTFYFFPAPGSHVHEWDCSYQLSDSIVYGRKKMSVHEMIHEIDKAGWEIGLHGSYHSALNEKLLSAQKAEIEDATGKAIISTRQHYLHYDVRLTPNLQERVGFKTDSTQGFNRSIGFRAATSFPYTCWNHAEEQPLSILEIPQHIMDGGLFTNNALEYDADLAIKHSIQLMDEVEAVGGCLTLSWHPHNIVNEMWWQVYKTLIEEAHHRNAWGCSAGEIYNYWEKNETAIVQSSHAEIGQ